MKKEKICYYWLQENEVICSIDWNTSNGHFKNVADMKKYYCNDKYTTFKFVRLYKKDFE